jgi:hypothetical protein
LSDVSSFSNSDSSSYNQNSSQSENSDEKQDVITDAMNGLLPKNTTKAINAIWQQTPMIKEQSTQQGFITESPFSFKNPIFFSAPRDNGSKKVKLLQSKRQLFGGTKQTKKS